MKMFVMLVAAAVCFPLVSQAQHNHAGHTSCAGMQQRAIKSLSDADIQELRRSGGWGLALPAELNGMPGPAHLLELKDQIPLTAEQAQRIHALFDDMKRAAIPAGERLIQTESEIEAAFASGKVDESTLRQLVTAAESARAELRIIHLSQHFKTVPLLRPEQIQRYTVLRGYATAPCQNIPAGHNPEMHRRHMGCQ